jgi:decaprenyl-phosphate phosphoribosyltransferase
MKAIISLIRVKSWVKNGFIFLPLIFSLNLLHLELAKRAGWAFIAFSLACSFIYVINDWVDADKDALHPRKKLRPLPSGAISKSNALMIALICMAGALAVIYFAQLPDAFTGILAVYVVLNLAYSFVLKQINIIEFFVVAVNFVFRVLAGCYVIAVNPTSWILVVSFFLALFLILIKRKSELMMLDNGAKNHRAVLAHYSQDLLDKFLFVVATITITAYLLYTMDTKVQAALHTDKILYTSIFVVLGIFRFIQLSHFKAFDGEGDPTTLLFKDRFTQINLILWMSSLIVILYA